MQISTGKTGDFSDYDIRRAKYFYTCLLYELSKFFILGLVFHLLDLFPEYLFSILFICPARILSGGLHFRNYFGCLLFSILYFFMGIIFLGNFHPSGAVVFFSLLLFALINLLIGPITSNQRPQPSLEKIHLIKKHMTFLFMVYAMFFLFFGQNRFYHLGYRLLLIHTAQMIVAFIGKEVSRW